MSEIYKEIEEWRFTSCPYCNCKARHVGFSDIQDGNETWHNNREYALCYCPTCLHWEFRGSEAGNMCMDPSQAIMASSVLARFDDHLPEACSEELSLFLRRFPAKWHELSPRRMETLVADIFRANYKHCEVVHVGKPGDRGIDVVFVDDHNKRWLIQVKRRSKPKKAEGFATLQSVLGTLALEGERHGMIVSTADYFSYQARKESVRARQQGFVVELIDKGILDRMIGALLPIAPWRSLFGHPSLKHLENDVRLKFGGDESQTDLFG